MAAAPPPLFMQQQPGARATVTPGPFFFNLEFQAWGTDLIRWRSIACFFWFGCAAVTVLTLAITLGPIRHAAATVSLAALVFLVTSFLLLSFDLSDIHVRGSPRQTRRDKLLLFLKPSNIFRFLFNALFGAASLLAWNVLVPLVPGGGRLVVPCGQSECAQMDVALSLLAGISSGAAFAAHYIYTQRTMLRFPSLHMNRLARMRMQFSSQLRLMAFLTLGATIATLILVFPFGRLVLRLLIKVLHRQPVAFTSLPLSLASLSSLTFRTALGCAAYLSLTLFARLLVETFLTQWYAFETRSALRGQLLLYGMENPLPTLVHYLAMQDAARVAESFPERRRALFGADIADGRAREGWKTFCTGCIAVLDALTLALRPVQDPTAPITTTDPFADYQLQAWAARALAGMLVASKTEDTYGVVQSTGSIGASLQSLVNCLMAVEAYLHSAAAPRLEGAHECRPVAHEMHATLRSAVYAITTNFFQYLSGFALPPNVALKLQSFVHFNE